MPQQNGHLSQDSLRFLLDLLERQQLTIGSPDFLPLAQRVNQVLTELRTAVVSETVTTGGG